MRIYKHLTYTDRLRIEKWTKEKMKPTEIASKLRVHHSTIYRELKRGEFERLNGETWEKETAYSADIAEEKYQRNLREKGPDIKLGRDYALANYIENTIIEKECSPAAALGYAQNEGKKFGTSISVPTLYRYIERGIFLKLTKRDLPRRGQKKQPYEKVGVRKAKRAPAGESIEKRPEKVKEREEFGHWEMDTVYSGKKKNSRALLVLTERKTRKEIIIGIEDRKAETVIQAIDMLEKKMGMDTFKKIFRTVTMDNGSEFQKAEQIERSCTTDGRRTHAYYCHPYSSWERGTNENQNGMIRRKHPKGTDFGEVTDMQLAETEEWINNYPRKIFGYKSSEIMYQKCIEELGIAS